MLPRGLNVLLGLMLTVCALLTCRADAPATRPVHPYFPVASGTTWKYLVTAATNDKADKPFVLTLKVGEAVEAGGKTLFPIDGELYEVKAEGVFLVGHREGDKTIALPEPQKILPAKPRSGEAWNATAKSDSAYITCLGTQTIKTEAGDFTAQCLFVTSGVEGGTQRQTYRYFARGVGLVRETVSEKTKRGDGSFATHEVTRDLIAFTPVSETKPEAVQVREPIGTDSLKGELLDPGGQPIAQATLTLQRLDKPGTQLLQTDLTGRFSAGDLDPAGSYLLATRLIGYESVEMPLRSGDRKPVLAAVKLKSAAPAESGGAESAFAAGKKFAAEGDHKGALAKYAEALAADPKNAAIVAYKAMSQLALGQTKEASQSADEALKLNEKDALVWEVVGQVKVAQNQINQARAVFDKAAQLSPKTGGAMYMDLAAAMAAKNDNKLAGDIESALKAAASADPPSAEALFQLGQSAANAGKQEGKGYLQKYVEIAVKLPEAEQDKQKIQVAKQLIRALDALKQK
jgi:tetratricopeptide (TPR) repeat protein